MPKRLRKWKQGFLIAVCVAIVALFVAFNARQRHDLLPAFVFQRLSKSHHFVVMPQWNVELLTCLTKDVCTTQGTATVVFPNGVAQLESLLNQFKGVTHARLTPSDGVAPWASQQNERYAVLVLPRSVQNWVVLERGGHRDPALWVGVGATPRFTVPMADLAQDTPWSLLFQIKGLPWFGTGDYPPAWVVASQSEDYALLPERLQQGALLMTQLELGLPVLFAAMALILDHALIFGVLAVWALVRALRTAAVFWVLESAAWPGVYSVALVAEGAQCCLLVTVALMLSHTLEDQWIYKRWNTWVTAVAFGCLGAGGVFLAVDAFTNGFLMSSHLWGDGVGAFLGLGILGGKGAYTLWLLKKRKEGETNMPPPRAPLAVSLPQMAFQWALIGLALGFHGWVNARDLFSTSDPWQRDPLDPRHIQLFPMLFAASLLGVGRMSRFVGAFAQKAVEVAVVEQEIGYAKTVQERMLPRRKVEGPTWAFRSWHRAATGLAGDWFGVHGARAGGQDVVLACVADITGHGIGAAMVTSTLCSHWNVFCRKLDPGLPPDGPQREAWALDAVEHLNTGLLALGHNDTCTAIVLVLAPALCQGTVVSAAHLGPLILEPQGARYVPVPGNAPVGAVGGGGWKAQHVEVAPGGRIVLFSDGIVPPNVAPSVWLKRWIRQVAGLTPQGCLGRLVEQLRANRKIFKTTPGVEDDITLVDIRLKPEILQTQEGTL